MATQNSWNSQDPVQTSLGGTGLASLTSHGILQGNGAGNVTVTAELTNGQLLIGNTGNFATVGTLTPGTNIGISNGSGTVTINATGLAGFSWTDVSGTSQAMAINSGYTSNNAGLVTLTLPTTAAYGSMFTVLGKGAGGWKIAQNASQSINFGSVVTTTGTGGSLASTNAFDSVTLICTTANNGYAVTSSIGNITYA